MILNNVQDNLSTYYNKCYSYYYPRILIFSYKILRNHAIAEEITQDVFLKFYEIIDKVEQKEKKVKNLLYTIARHKCYDYHRKEMADIKKLKKKKIQQKAFDKKFQYDLENSYIEGEIISTTNDIINSFPAKEKEIFVDIFFNKKSESKVCKNKQISAHQLRKIKKELKSEIRNKLSPYFKG